MLPKATQLSGYYEQFPNLLEPRPFDEDVEAHPSLPNV